VNAGRWIIMAVCLALGYGAFSFMVWSRDFGLVDSAIADVLAVTRAQVHYAGLNGGLSERDLSCLDRRGTCIPSQQSAWAGRALVESGRDTGTLSVGWMRQGRHFTAGPAADPRLIQEQGLSPSSVQGFRYVADTSSTRPWWFRASLLPRPPLGFCGDASGHVCELSSLPTLAGVSCPVDCKRLE
jgi:hypothetical protein